MSYANERAAIGAAVKTWATANGVLMAYPNRDFKPPVLAPAAKWGRLTIQEGIPFPLEISGPNRQHRHPGIVVVQLFTAQDTGDKGALDLGDSLAAVFRHARMTITNGSVLFRTPYIQTIGTGPDGWYQVNLNAPYIRDAMFA